MNHNNNLLLLVFNHLRIEARWFDQKFLRYWLVLHEKFDSEIISHR